MIIAIEGMDGAGKTTIAQYIVHNYNFKLIDKPNKYLFYDKNGIFDMESFNRTLENVYKTNDPLIKTWFFALGNIISTKIYKNDDVVIDRHFASNYFWNSDETLEEVYTTLVKCIGVPDITFLVKASPSVRKERIKKRDHNDPDLLDNDKFLYGYDKMEYFLDRFEIPYIVINTEYKNEDEVCNDVKNVMNKIYKKKMVKRI